MKWMWMILGVAAAAGVTTILLNIVVSGEVEIKPPSAPLQVEVMNEVTIKIDEAAAQKEADRVREITDPRLKKLLEGK